MSRYSVEDRVQMIKFYYANGENATLALRKWTSVNKNRPKPDVHAVTNLVEKFERTGSVANDYRARKEAGRRSVTPEDIEGIRAIIEENPTISTRRLTQMTNISRTSVMSVLKNDLKKFPYKIQTRQLISESQVIRRFNFASEFCEMIDREEVRMRDVIFSDEAHFWLNGYVNRQNYRIWGSEKPNFVNTKPLHPQKLTVFCAVGYEEIFGPVFIYQTVDSDAYEGILTDYLLPAAEDLGWLDGNHWFQQDGAPPHATRENLKIVHRAFGPKVIALKYPDFHGGGLEWPPNSPDLTVCDFFLWGYLKDKVYKNRPKTLDELADAIRKAISEIPADMLRRANEGAEKRLRMCVVTGGHHIENVIH